MTAYPVEVQLRDERIRQHLTLAQVADKIPGYATARDLCAWEYGHRQPSVPQLHRWAMALGMGIGAVPAAALVSSGLPGGG